MFKVGQYLPLHHMKRRRIVSVSVPRFTSLWDLLAILIIGADGKKNCAHSHVMRRSKV
ncbi:MAG: hypothetical protein LC776_18475 [Acidobacteria bacterium]|nr:hypothetical protein [Acidobacteriota bacterium]